jgi:hypothetical protein
MTSVEFNPYHRWLGIPPDEPPPTHYRLLGLKRGDTLWVEHYLPASAYLHSFMLYGVGSRTP